MTSNAILLGLGKCIEHSLTRIRNTNFVLLFFYINISQICDVICPQLAVAFYGQRGACDSLVKRNQVLFLTSRLRAIFSTLYTVSIFRQTASYKLKTRLAVSDLWLKESIDGVTEDVVAADRSFVIGWPTISYVATFT